MSRDCTSNLPQRIIDAFGGLTEMSRKLNGVPITTIQSWRDKGRIPHWRRREISEAAAREGVSLPREFHSVAA